MQAFLPTSPHVCASIIWMIQACSEFVFITQVFSTLGQIISDQRKQKKITLTKLSVPLNKSAW